MYRSIQEEKAWTPREVGLLAITVLFILLTRLPWIGAGYGADPDAYRVVNAARQIAETGVYNASRLPGFPLYEYIVAYTPAKTNPFFSNALTALGSCIASVFFVLILRWFQVKSYLLLTLAFALTPVVYIHSTGTMDYMMAMMFVLGATYFAITRRFYIAGLFLGLAIGCRITSGAMLLPIVAWMLMDDRSVAGQRRMLTLCGTTLIVGGVCFLPVFYRYGMGFLTHYDTGSYPPASLVIGRGTVKVWGVLGSLGLAALCCIAPFKTLKKDISSLRAQRGLIVCSMAVAIYLLAFLWLPQDGAYLIPIIPFVLLAVGLIVPPYAIRWLTSALICSSLFIGVDREGVTLAGPIVRDHWNRLDRHQEVERITEAVERLTSPAVIVAGGRLPQISERLGSYQQQSHEYIYLIETADSYERYLEAGRTVYFLEGTDAYNLEKYGVDISRLGAIALQPHTEAGRK